MRAMFPSTSFCSGACMGSVDLALMDVALLPVSEQRYWDAVRIPHLVLLGDEPPPALPRGWAAVSERLSHKDLGGASDGEHSLLLLLPSQLAADCGRQASLPTFPWTPLRSSINPVLAAPRAAAPPVCSSPRAWVCRTANGKEVLPHGLFPSNSPDVRVRVPCVCNKPTFWGVRRLSPTELADV